MFQMYVCTQFYIETRFCFVISAVMPPEDECIELGHQSAEESSGTFAQEVVKEAFGDSYTEHVKITLKNIRDTYIHTYIYTGTIQYRAHLEFLFR